MSTSSKAALFFGGMVFGAFLFRAGISPGRPIWWVVTLSFTLVWATIVMVAFRRRA